MIHPTDNQIHPLRAVRNGRAAPVTCASCGCRLEAVDDSRWLHFGRLGGRDARGCRVECAELPHDVHGRAVAVLTA